jgi:hypothetical protein
MLMAQRPSLDVVPEPSLNVLSPEAHRLSFGVSPGVATPYARSKPS